MNTKTKKTATERMDDGTLVQNGNGNVRKYFSVDNGKTWHKSIAKARLNSVAI